VSSQLVTYPHGAGDRSMKTRRKTIRYSVDFELIVINVD